MENWKDVVGYEGLYEVSDKGNVRNKRNGRVLKGTLNSSEYLIVHLFKNGSKTVFIHRLVAEAFIPNLDNKPCVDHINADRMNNTVENLRWCTYKENMNNPMTKKNIKGNKGGIKGKKVMCVTTGEIFDSAAEATRHYNVANKSAVDHAANPKKAQRYAGQLSDGTKLEWKYI